MSHSSDPRVFRCEKDGLCIITDKVGTRSLIGGFRRGNEEMKFEVLHRPVADPDQEQWCKRLQDTLGERMYSNDGPGCPEGWSNTSYLGPEHHTIQEPNDRWEMVHGILQEMAAQRAPVGREEAWGIIFDTLQRMYETRTDKLYDVYMKKHHPDVPNSATGDYRAIGDPNYDGHTPPDIPYPPKKKVN